MFKKILVPTDGSESALVGSRYAIALATRHDACLRALHVVDVKLLEGPFLQDLSASLGTTPYVNYQGNAAMILDERGKAALEEVRQACEEAGVPCETALVTGIVPRAIVEHSHLTDLIVMGRAGEHREWLEGLVGSTTEAVVRRATQPVLVTATGEPGGQRVLVAYDGSEHARHALKVAASMAVDWGRPLILLAVGDSEKAALTEARGYLQAYDLDVDYVPRSGDPGETIVAYAAECEAGLIVMGAYGHSKVRELVIGSTTDYVMHHAPCPVLLTR